MNTNTGTEQYFLRKDYAEDILVPSFIDFLKERKVVFTSIKMDIIRAFQEAVRNGTISTADLNSFLDKETRFGHNRTLFLKDIDSYSSNSLKKMSEKEIYELIISKGWQVPSQNSILNVYRPEELTLVEVGIEEGCNISLTFIEEVEIKKKDIIDRQNNYYFVNVDLINNIFSVRMRPRGNNVVQVGFDEYKIVTDVQCFYKIKNWVQKMLNLSLLDSSHFKSTLYKIAKDLTEKAEEPWRKEVEKHNDEIETFSQEMLSKLEGIKPDVFDLEFRLKRLLERALIQSNFKKMKEKEPGKKGFVNAFHFSDRSGGKIKASSREKERAIDLSEIYYDTRDTIDKKKAYDIVWANWFVPGKKVSLSTRLEANDEFYQIHFYNYLSEDELYYVLSEIKHFKNKPLDE
ncbi:hypothetical protein [Rossellomorea sp. BNER]|uniref:hypothetical protein n=1 Tax=Rossellomorea sp. BNER TaxID=2962031 RepID=UPI003AF2F141|nr:hypothetical protein [Rossellomorea sp. BNER]